MSVLWCEDGVKKVSEIVEVSSLAGKVVLYDLTV